MAAPETVADNPEPTTGDAGGAPAPSGPSRVEPQGSGEKGTPDVEVPRFFSPSKPQATVEPDVDEIDRIDPTKLPPELQKTYKQLQAAATRKFQAAADLRRQAEKERHDFLEERTKWLESRTTEPAAAPQSEDPLVRVRELREQGNHDEADRLLYELSSKEAEDRLRPITDEAKLNSLRTSFRDSVSDSMQVPIVAQYKSQVEQIFDSRNPDIEMFRGMLFREVQRNPNAMKIVKPFLYLLATEQHAINLEKNIDKIVDKLVGERLQAEFNKAKGAPTRLIPSSSTSRETSPGREGDIRKAINLALSSTG